MKTHTMAARMFGIFFIFTFISYGFGSGLVDSIVSSSDMLVNVYANKTQVIIGVILMALIHSALNIALPLIMLPILEPYSRRLTYGYLCAAVIATVILAVGAIFLLLLLPLSDAYLSANSITASNIKMLAIILKQGGHYAYQLGMAVWGFGGLMFCYLLLQSNLVPRILVIWGVLGYLIFITGTLLELFGYNIGVLLSLPGGLFEIFLSFWLIIKGFNLDGSNESDFQTANADIKLV